MDIKRSEKSMGIDTDIYYLNKKDYEIIECARHDEKFYDGTIRNVLWKVRMRYKKVYEKPILKSDVEKRYYSNVEYTEEGFLKSFDIISCWKCKPLKLRTMKGKFIKFEVIQHKLDWRTEIHSDGLDMVEIRREIYDCFACIDKKSEYFKIITYN